MWSASLPAVCPVYLCASVGPLGATCLSACPVLHHSESGPLGLSVCDCRATGSANHCSACPVLRHSESSPLGLSVRECGAAGSASGQTACPVYPTLRHSQSSRPQLPVSAPPTGLDECLFFISLVSDFLAIRFSVSSGCARRRSVSTYAAILVIN